MSVGKGNVEAMEDIALALSAPEAFDPRRHAPEEGRFDLVFYAVGGGAAPMAGS